jgi:TP901 family phage tail tape measure protein
MAASAEGNVKITVKAEDKTKGAFGSAFKNIDKLGKAAGAAVLGATVVAGAAIAGVATKGVMEFVKFEDQLNEVFTLLPGISGVAMAEMEKQVLDTSVAMGRMPDEIIPALYQSLSAGVPTDNVFEFLETAHQASLGGVTELTTAVDGITSVVNAYGAETIGATDASDLMFTAVRLGKTTFGELAGSLSNVTPIASAMNVGFGDVTAALATMTSQGTNTAQASTQMRALLQELGTAGTEVSGIFEKVAGVSFLQFAEEGGNVSEALGLLEQHALDTNTPIQDMFGNVRQPLTT